MKTNQQIAQAFANGATSGKSGNMFIDGDTIYSYGYHFPIATRLRDGLYLFNNIGYSNTTAKHKNHVSAAISGKKIITRHDHDGSNWGRTSLKIDTAYLEELKAEALSKFDKARTLWSKDKWLSDSLEYSKMIELAKKYL